MGGILEVLLFASCFWMAVAVSPSASPSSLVSRSQSPGVCPAALLSCTLRWPKWQDVQWEMARIRLTQCQGHTYHAYSFVIYGEMKRIRKNVRRASINSGEIICRVVYRRSSKSC